MSDPTPIADWTTLEGHECEEIARMHNCGEGRELWVGRLTAPIEGYEHETHCIHLTTPKKEVVFGVYRGDMSSFLAICQVVLDDVYGETHSPVNKDWVDSLADSFRSHAQGDGE